MKEFIEYLLKQIVSKPESITVDEAQAEGLYVYTIHAAQEDLGTIIGKEGRNINSLRNMAKVKAIRDNVRIKIMVEDNKEEE
jgi:predicted RNA-binding protein YlqC (UPF0109 family)